MTTVVLQEPQELVNIAQVVRAMKNFGVRDLRLVRPREFDPVRIEGIAHQSGDILARVRCFDTLDAAVADCVYVVGLTARGRTANRNWQRPRAAAADVAAWADTGRVGLLFGREDKGLSNEALDRCTRVVTIPSEPSYPSLNLAHAVVVMLYEIALARGAGDRAFKPARRTGGDPATAADLERVFGDLERALVAVAFFKTRDAERVMRTLRDILHRVPLDAREAKLLRAMAIEVAKYGGRVARSRLHVDR